jgi:glyoxylase-like metal-dependent hydrolase (beta-lactamase superfamily II)
MLEIRPGVYCWNAPHPDWAPGCGWDELVTSYAFEAGEGLLVVDPLAPPPEFDQMTAGRAITIVVTCGWHRRDSDALAARLGAELFVPVPDAEHPDPGTGTIYRDGDPIMPGVKALPGMEASDMLLWDERHRALIAGDTMIDRGEGLCIPYDWADEPEDPEQVRKSLLHLLELPIDMVLPTHGLPTDRAALERALAPRLTSTQLE